MRTVTIAFLFGVISEVTSLTVIVTLFPQASYAAGAYYTLPFGFATAVAFAAGMLFGMVISGSAQRKKRTSLIYRFALVSVGIMLLFSVTALIISLYTSPALACALNVNQYSLVLYSLLSAVPPKNSIHEDEQDD